VKQVRKIIPIDLGFGWGKGREGIRIFRQPSVIGDSKQLFDEQKRPGDIIYGERIFDRLKNEEIFVPQYFVGGLALRHSDVKYYTLKDNKADTWTSGVLFKTILSYLSQGEPANIVTGLPIDYYFNQRGDFETFLNEINGHKVDLEIIGKGFYSNTININKYKITLQPMGAAMDYLLGEDGQFEKIEDAKKQLLIIDWGRYTLDLLILDAMEIYKASCSPPDLGIEAVYRLLRRYLREHIGSAPAAYDMDSVVNAKEYQGYDVSPLIDKAFEAVIQQIQLEIEGMNMNFHKYILAGGQSDRLFQYLEFDQKNMVKGDQLSNLNGYEKIGYRLWPREE
jgi:plasmid segregation protein ParM